MVCPNNLVHKLQTLRVSCECNVQRPFVESKHEVNVLPAGRFVDLYMLPFVDLDILFIQALNSVKPLRSYKPNTIKSFVDLDILFIQALNSVKPLRSYKPNTIKYVHILRDILLLIWLTFLFWKVLKWWSLDPTDDKLTLFLLHHFIFFQISI